MKNQLLLLIPKQARKIDKYKEEKFVWDPGLTLPLKMSGREGSRRQQRSSILSLQVWEKEWRAAEHRSGSCQSSGKMVLCENQLNSCLRPVSSWEGIAEHETKERENQGLAVSSAGTSGHRQAHDSLEPDELRERVVISAAVRMQMGPNIKVKECEHHGH